MAYDIQSQILPNGQMLIHDSESGASVVFKNCQDGLYMVYCDTGSSKAIEYPLLEEFFETAATEFELEERFGTSEEKSYTGCMLGIKYAEKAEILNEINENGDSWCDDTTEDELYIIVGKNLSNIRIYPKNTFAYPAHTNKRLLIVHSVSAVLKPVIFINAI